MNPFRRRSAMTLMLALLAAPAFAASTDDSAFVQQAGHGGMAEVEAGKLAQAKGLSEQVKQHGARMVADHGKANDELKRIATGKAIVVPATLDPKHQQAQDKLAGLSGAQFDRAYKQQMVQDHRQTIALFEKQAKAGEDAQLKAFAARQLPALREHLKLSQALP